MPVTLPAPIGGSEPYNVCWADFYPDRPHEFHFCNLTATKASGLCDYHHAVIITGEMPPHYNGVSAEDAARQAEREMMYGYSHTGYPANYDPHFAPAQ